MRAAVALLMILGLIAWAWCFGTMLGAETAAARAAYGAMLLVGLGALTLLSFFVWPGRA